MRTVIRSARGASAYTHDDSYSTGTLDEAGLLSSDEETAPVRTWSELIDDLLDVRNLEDDWDGQGAPAPHPSLVDGAITLAQDLQAKGTPPAARVIAGVNGTIFFEWHTPLGYYEIEVITPQDAEWRWVPTGSDVAEVGTLTRRS